MPSELGLHLAGPPATHMTLSGSRAGPYDHWTPLFKDTKGTFLLFHCLPRFPVLNLQGSSAPAWNSSRVGLDLSLIIDIVLCLVSLPAPFCTPGAMWVAVSCHEFWFTPGE